MVAMEPEHPLMGVDQENNLLGFAKRVKRSFPKVRHGKYQLGISMVVFYYLINYGNFFPHPTNPFISEIRMAVFGVNLYIAYISCFL